MADFPTTGFLAPTPADYKRMWEERTQEKMDALDRPTTDQVRRQAIKEVLQDQVKRSTTPQKRLDDTFKQSVDRHLRGR